MISSVFGAIIFAVLLWVLCAFAGRLVNSSYRMPPLLHLLCFAVAVPTVVLLVVVFMCNKVIRKVADVDAGIAKVLMSDGKFVDRLRQEINQAATTKDAGELTDYLAENLSDRISSEYPAVGKYVDVNQILEHTDLDKRISQLSQGASDVDAGKVQEMVQAVAGRFTEGIRARIKSVRRKALLPVLLLQAVAFGVVFYRASKYRSPAQKDYACDSSYAY